MISTIKTDIIKNEKEGKKIITVELRGLSTDTKPEKIGDNVVGNGSIYICIDTGDIYMYDLQNKQWRQFNGGE